MISRLSLITSFLLPLSCFSQELSHVIFTGATTLSSFAFKTDQQVIIKISETGTVMEWGLEWERYRYDYRPGKLQPFPGRVDYYGPEADSINRGKLKSIGTTFLTYYGIYETEEKKGKLRSIGTAILDYYSNYENQLLRGRLQWAGSTLLQYYSSFENESIRGKLRAVGNTPITWYSSFDEKWKNGKIKSIGPLNYTWTDNRGFTGTWQSIPLAPIVNGVFYIVL